MNSAVISSLAPSVFIKNSPGGSEQLFRIKIKNLLNSRLTLSLLIRNGKYHKSVILENLLPGDNTREIFIREPECESKAEFILTDKTNQLISSTEYTLKPAKHWKIHLIHHSHHDLGYTDLPSRVIQKHCKHLNDAIDLISGSMKLSESARMKIVLEQSWSLDHFLKTAPAGRVKKIINLMRSGYIELTAFFGNMITEISGHESLIRNLYFSRTISEKYGIPVISAHHNDIPGMSGGIATVLAEAGIKILCAGIPEYYQWGQKLESTWHPEKIFGVDGPGVFRWETPARKEILVWTDAGYSDSLGNLEHKLSILEKSIYQGSIHRIVITGSGGDNSLYSTEISGAILEWNKKWQYPKLHSSTTVDFYNDLIKEINEQTPLLKGEYPGQDYPLGVSSQAQTSALNRNTHIRLANAEKIAAAASCLAGHKYPADEINSAYENTLFSDEHVFGFHFPAGPAMLAAEAEKSVFAYKAAALAHDVTSKALARIADNINLDRDSTYLMVFNPLGWQRNGLVRISMRDLDCCGLDYKKIPSPSLPGRDGLKIVSLNTRWHVILTEDMLAGKFTLRSPSDKKDTSFQIIEIDKHDAPIEYAPQRFGLGSGGRRYGFFENPSGIKKELVFTAEDVPAYGYKIYQLKPSLKASSLKTRSKKDSSKLENQWYRITYSPKNGQIKNIYDKDLKQELFDSLSGYGFAEFYSFNPLDGTTTASSFTSVPIVNSGSVLSSLSRTLKVPGAPAIAQEIIIYEKLKKISVNSRVLKDSAPLLGLHIAFPFNIKKPHFQYEGTLGIIDPAKDFFPGTHPNTLAVQNWVSADNNKISLLWSSLDAPVVKLGGLWRDYTSQAHSCVMDEVKIKGFISPEALNKKAWIFSQIYNNNYGTNFSVSQIGETLFRYEISSSKKSASDNAEKCRTGWENMSQLNSIFGRSSADAQLPLKSGLLEVKNKNIILLTAKKAEDGLSMIFRFWNTSDAVQRSLIKINIPDIVSSATLCDILEKPMKSLGIIKNVLKISFNAHEIITIKSS